jgi:hypothetical protein
VDDDRGRPDVVNDDGVWHGISLAADGDPYHEEFCGGGHERGGRGEGDDRGNGEGRGNGNEGEQGDDGDDDNGDEGEQD